MYQRVKDKPELEWKESDMKLGRAQSVGVVEEPIEEVEIVSESSNAVAPAEHVQPDRTEERQPATS